MRIAYSNCLLRKGTIIARKLVDVAVLSDDIVHTKAEDLRKTRVACTILSRRVLYRREGSSLKEEFDGSR
jgi:predicted amidohydrolase YtcJ